MMIYGIVCWQNHSVDLGKAWGAWFDILYQRVNREQGSLHRESLLVVFVDLRKAYGSSLQ